MKTFHWVLVGAGVVVLVLALMFGLPVYNVWMQGLAGEGSLKRAEQEKQIMIETAKAEVEAAKLQAEAIKIVGEMAKEYPEYRHQQFIQAMGDAIQDGDVRMIFVPTEANIPILKTVD